jgi:protein-S-isoprenylcysteine O-methyltransferase Ste14
MFEFPKRYADAVARARVPSGFVIVFLFGWLAHPSAQSLAIGLPISLLGLALRAWAAGCLFKDQKLATGGPYQYTRNPLYLGTLIVAAGLVTAARNPWLAAVFAAVFVLVYLPVIQLEQQHLHRLFPEYAAYAREVPAVAPRLTPSREFAAGAHAFRWSQYVHNREYQAGLGWLAGAAFLVGKWTLG